MTTVQTGTTNTVRARVRPKILSGAWISLDFRETEYNPDDPYVGSDGNSLKLEHTCIGDRVIARIKTRGIPSHVRVAFLTIKEDDFLRDDIVSGQLRANRVEIDGELTDIFEAEVEFTREFYEKGTNSFTDKKKVEYQFIAEIRYREDQDDVVVKKDINDIVVVDLDNLIITICPRTRTNLFVVEEGDTAAPTSAAGEELEENNDIKEVLERFKKAKEDIQPFKDNKLFEDYKETFKEVEYSFYLNFIQEIGIAGNYGRKNLTIIVENRYKNEADEEDNQGRMKNTITLKVTRASGSEELRFLDDGRLHEELEIEVTPDENDSTNNAVAEVALIHPLVAADGLEDTDKTLKIKVELQDFPEIYKEIELEIKRNEDISLKDIGITEGRTNTLSEPNGFWVREIVDGNDDYSTFNAEIRDRLQKIVTYDLDRRGVDNEGARNGVDGHFRHYLNNDTTYDTVHYLNSLIGRTGNDASLKGSQFNNARPFGELDIDVQLADYLLREYGYNYRTDTMIGEIIDRMILVGANNNNSAPASIDGLLELLQYNENNRANATADYIAHNMERFPGTDNCNLFNALMQENSPDGNWYEVNGRGETLIEPSNDNDKRPRFNYRRRHEGVDYVREQGKTAYIKSPMYVKIRSKGVGVDSDHIIFSFELIGIEREMRVLHCNRDSSLDVNYIYYPNERITNYPTSRDAGMGIHVHIEKWMKRRIKNRTLLVNPNSDRDSPAEGTYFYLKGYDAAVNGDDNIPRSVHKIKPTKANTNLLDCSGKFSDI